MSGSIVLCTQNLSNFRGRHLSVRQTDLDWLSKPTFWTFTVEMARTGCENKLDLGAAKPYYCVVIDRRQV